MTAHAAARQHRISEWVTVPVTGADEARFHITFDVPIVSTADAPFEGDVRIWSGREYTHTGIASHETEHFLPLAGSTRLHELTAGLRPHDAIALSRRALDKGLGRLLIVGNRVWYATR